MFLTSDQALSDQSGGQNEIPRHFMVISKPCIHPDTPQREGYIRGQYESVEFIREIPKKKAPKKSASTTNLTNHTRNRSSTLGKEATLRNARKHSPPAGENGSATPDNEATSDSDAPHSEGRARGKTISFDRSRGFEAKGESFDIPHDEEDRESNPVEWIMITRSDPGGSVPRFMVERGTPGGIVSDASKFLDWACAKGLEDFDDDDETLTGDDQDENAERHEHKHDHQSDLHNYQTNGHLAGLQEEQSEDGLAAEPAPQGKAIPDGTGYYDMVTVAAAAAGAMITNHLPGHNTEQDGTAPARHNSVSRESSISSAGSFASALENNDDEASNNNNNDASSTETNESPAQTRDMALNDKELQKLEDKKRKLDERLSKVREKESSKKSSDSAREEEALRKAESKHRAEVKKQEEKYRREVEKLELKRAKEERKAEERKRKAAEKDEKTRLVRELEELRAEVGVLRKERMIMLEQVGALQAENTALATRVGRVGLLEVRDEVGKADRARASSLKGLARPSSLRSSTSSLEKDKDNPSLQVPTAAS